MIKDMRAGKDVAMSGPRLRHWNAGRRALGLAILVVTLPLATACSGGSAAPAPGASVIDGVMERGVLRAGIRFDNPPHSFIDEGGEWIGFDVDIAAALAEELGVELEMVRVDELTRISFLKNGTIDVAVASMSHTHQRELEIDFSQTYFWSKQTFLVRGDEITSLEDLVGKTVGMDRGSSAIGNWRDWLADNGFPDEPQIVEFSDKQAAAEAVRQGAVAGWAEDYEILASFARVDASLAVLEGEGIGLKLDGIGVRENDSKMLDAVNAALQRIAVSGTYDEIYDRWFGPNSDTPVPRQGEIEVWPQG
jgi:polar amino acid transport system substrate-binding protein